LRIALQTLPPPTTAMLELRKISLISSPLLINTIRFFDYCLNSRATLTQGIWMSFFDTEEAHAGMLAYAADRGPADQRSPGPGSSGKSRLNAAAQFGAKKDIHIPHFCHVNGHHYAEESWHLSEYTRKVE
jgi:hypothetical protein